MCFGRFLRDCVLGVVGEFGKMYCGFGTKVVFYLYYEIELVNVFFVEIILLGIRFFGNEIFLFR